MSSISIINPVFNEAENIESLLKEIQSTLNEKINYKKTSYYDLAFDISSPGLEFNLFDLSPNVLQAIRKFREKFYIKSLFNMNISLVIIGCSTMGDCLTFRDISPAFITID